MTITGVDLSSYNGTPRDWQPVAGRIDFAAVKFTEYQPGGTRYVNPDAAADWAALKMAGHARIAYLYAHPSTPAGPTVDLFVAEAEKLGLADGDGIALDLEVTDGLKSGVVDDWARLVLGDLQHLFHRRPLVYTFLSFAHDGNCSSLGGYPLWIADPSSPEGHPRIPAPWKAWAIHQYRTGAPIDRDVANYPDLTTMRKALGKQLPTHGWVTTAGKGSLAALGTARGHRPSAILASTIAGKPAEFAPGLAAYVDAAMAAYEVAMGKDWRLLLP